MSYQQIAVCSSSKIIGSSNFHFHFALGGYSYIIPALARAPTITLSSHDLVQVGPSSRPYVEYQDRQWVSASSVVLSSVCSLQRLIDMEWRLVCVLALAPWFAGRTQGRLSATINEPGGPSTASSPVLLQTEAPRNITVVTARTYEISCSSNMGVTPVWRHNDSLVTNSPPTSGTPGVYVREPANRERVLVLQNVTQSVVGTYVCLEGTGEDADSATFVVTTANPTAIPGFPQREVDAGTSGTRETLHVLISATPPPQGSEVLWYFNGNLIVDGAPPLNIRILEPNEITFPRRITTVLMGTYTCVVNTTAGVGTATFRVQVRVQPSLTISPATNVTTRVGLSITITCTDTEGSPAPTFIWTHNDGPLEPDDRITFTKDTVTQSSQLTITSLMPGDRGTYRCLAVNPRGSANKEIHVNVQYAPILSGISENLTTWVVDDEVLITAHLTDSNPPFTSHRLLKDAQLVTSDRIQVTYRNSSGNFTFRIPQVMVSDEGRYTLEVTNPIGTGHINFTIIVYSPPTLVDPRAFFYGTVGNSVTINLTILNAKPLVQPANVSWIFNNVPISIDGNKFTQDVTPDGSLATLTIRDLNLYDDGGYRVNVRHISSDIPLASSIMQLVVRNPPNPPTNLTVTSDSNCFVNLSWIPPQTDDDTATTDTIVIEYSQDGRTWLEVARVPVSNTAATVRLPGGGGGVNGSYQWRARSHSDQFGDGRSSEPTVHFTLCPEGVQIKFLRNMTSSVEGGRVRVIFGREGYSFGDISVRITPLTYDQFEARGYDLDNFFPARPPAASISDINTTVITDSIQAGFSLYNFLLSIPIPDDTIVEASEGYVYLLEVIGPLHPQDVGRIDNTTSVLLVTINGTDGRIRITMTPREVIITEGEGKGLTLTRNGFSYAAIPLRVLLLTYDEYRARGFNLDDSYPMRPIPADAGVDFNTSVFDLSFGKSEELIRMSFSTNNDSRAELTEGFLCYLEVIEDQLHPRDVGRIDFFNRLVLVQILDNDAPISCTSAVEENTATIDCTGIDQLPTDANISCTIDGEPTGCTFPFRIDVSQFRGGQPQHQVRVMTQSPGDPQPQMLGGTQFILPELTLSFVNNTPLLNRDTFTARFEANRPDVQFDCYSTLPGVARENCSSGFFRRTNIPPGVYKLRVVAWDPVRKERAVIRNGILVHRDDTFCAVLKTNNGVTIGRNNNVTIEFSGTGRTTGFQCILDKQQPYFECESPLMLANLTVGNHHFKIIPQGCGRQYRAYPFKFTIN